MSKKKELSFFEKVILGEPDVTEEQLILEKGVEDVAEDVERRLGMLVEHLYKLAYCENDVDYNRDKRHWDNETSEHQRSVRKTVRWGGKRWTSVINAISLDRVQENAVTYYNKASKNNESLLSGRKTIPEKLPWTLDELMTRITDDLLLKLPQKKEWSR